MLDTAQENRTGQYLTFILDGELFGVDVRETREILDLPALTRVPQSPEYMLGVINLRGAIVPVVDLRRKFATAGTAPPANSCVIVLEVATADGQMVVGALADEVCEVLDLDDDQLRPAPRLGTAMRIDYIKGIGRHQERFMILLDTSRIFAGGELQQLQASAA